MRLGKLFLIAATLALAFLGTNCFAKDLPQRLLKDEVKAIGKGPANGDFTFVVMGDTRDGPGMFPFLIELANRVDPAFIINVGDLVHSGANNEQYLKYYNDISKGKAPFISVIGNHEAAVKSGYDRYKQMFGDTDFYFDYGGARFIIFDNSANGYTITDKQFEWLEKTFQTDKIKFVFMHAPPRTHIWFAAMDKPSSDRFMKLAEKFKVRKVFFGHDHAYDRLRRGETDYIMTGCAGAEPDPVTHLYHPHSGPFYHFMVVQVRGGKVIDSLVMPNTADIIDFKTREGIPLETAYAAYRHFNTPVVKSTKVESADEAAPIAVMVEAFSSPASLEAGLESVTVKCENPQGKATGPVALESDTFDERNWKGSLPALAGRPLNCVVTAKDSVKSATTNLFPIATKSDAPLPFDKVPFVTVGGDRDEPSSYVADEFDIREVAMAYDDKYAYFRVTLDAAPTPGDRVARHYNLIGLGLLDDSMTIEMDKDKMLSSVPLLVYAPLATQMGFPSCGVFDLSGFDKGQFKTTRAGVECKLDGKSLYFRADRKTLRIENSRGVKILAADGTILMESKPDIKMGDVADITHVILGPMAQ